MIHLSLTTGRASRIPIPTERSHVIRLIMQTTRKNISDTSKEKRLLFDSEYLILTIQAELISLQKEYILFYRWN